MEISASDVRAPLQDTYQDASMDACGVRRWTEHFTDGNTDIADQPRTACTEKNKGKKIDVLIGDSGTERTGLL